MEFHELEEILRKIDTIHLSERLQFLRVTSALKSHILQGVYNNANFDTSGLLKLKQLFTADESLHS